MFPQIFQFKILYFSRAKILDLSVDNPYIRVQNIFFKYYRKQQRGEVSW